MGSLAGVGLDKAKQVSTKMVFPARIPMESAWEAWLCSVVELLCTRQWGAVWHTIGDWGLASQCRAAGSIGIAMHAALTSQAGVVLQ